MIVWDYFTVVVVMSASLIVRRVATEFPGAANFNTTNMRDHVQKKHPTEHSDCGAKKKS